MPVRHPAVVALMSRWRSTGITRVRGHRRARMCTRSMYCPIGFKATSPQCPSRHCPWLPGVRLGPQYRSICASAVRVSHQRNGGRRADPFPWRPLLPIAAGNGAARLVVTCPSSSGV